MIKTWKDRIAIDYPHPFDRPEKEYMQAEIDDLRSENERLTRAKYQLEKERGEMVVGNTTVAGHMEELRAKLAALEGQEPVGWMHVDGFAELLAGKMQRVSPKPSNMGYAPLYLAAGATQQGEAIAKFTASQESLPPEMLEVLHQVPYTRTEVADVVANSKRFQGEVK